MISIKNMKGSISMVKRRSSSVWLISFSDMCFCLCLLTPLVFQLEQKKSEAVKEKTEKSEKVEVKKETPKEPNNPMKKQDMVHVNPVAVLGSNKKENTPSKNKSDDDKKEVRIPGPNDVLVMVFKNEIRMDNKVIDIQKLGSLVKGKDVILSCDAQTNFANIAGIINTMSKATSISLYSRN